MSLPCELVTLNLSQIQNFKMNQYTQNCPPLIKGYLNTTFKSIYNANGHNFSINITLP